jgi:NitT/TauT family transport system permease protein
MSAKGTAPAARNRLRTQVLIVRAASMVAVLGAWEILGRRINPLFMSYPSAIAKAAWILLLNGELLGALKSSLLTLVTGFVIASCIGVAMGLATDWIVNALYATPLIAIVPLVILWFGLGDAAKLFMVTVLATFPVLINTAAGVRNVSPARIDLGVAFAANERQIFMKIIVPAVLPYMMTGLRLGIGRAIIGMVAAEFFTAITGLGALIVKYGNQYDTASMFVPILTLMFLGVTLTAGVRRLEQICAPWRPQDE